MRCLITGCAGFIGSHTAEAFFADGHQVVGVDCFNDNYGRAQKLDNLRRIGSWDDFEFVRVDLACGNLDEYVRDCDTVIHAAAEPGVRASWGALYARYVRNNIVATQQLLEALQRSPDARLIYISSSSIYGDAKAYPTSEDAMPRPISPYGVSKLGGEQLAAAYQASFGLRITALRLFTVYGARQRPDMAFNIFCRAALMGEPIQLFGDGTQTRDFTHVSDVVRAIRCAANGPSDSIYNIGGGSPTSLKDAIKLVGDLAGRDLEIDQRERSRGDVQDTAADTRRATAELGFHARVSLREGLADEMGWIEEVLGSAPSRR